MDGSFPRAGNRAYSGIRISFTPVECDTVEFVADADPGIYPMHCHKVNHVMNGNSYPGGMLSAVVYTDAMDTDIFAGLVAAAGYEG